MQAVVILCQRREQEAVLEMLDAWREQSSITVYGITPKGNEGFIVTHWTPTVPVAFEDQHLKADPRIIDYLIYDVPAVRPAQNRTL